MADCDQEINGLPVLAGCPADTEYFLVIGASGGAGTGLYGLRSWLSLVNCLNTKQFGAGILTINGSQLTANKYLNSSLINKLVIFYNGFNRFMLHDSNDETYPASEWKYVAGGIEILIPGATFTSADIFTIFPNPGGNP